MHFCQAHFRPEVIVGSSMTLTAGECMQFCQLHFRPLARFADATGYAAQSYTASGSPGVCKHTYLMCASALVTYPAAKYLLQILP